MTDTRPLVIDLDGTLTSDDTLEVMARAMLRERPARALGAALHLSRGRPRLKHYLWSHHPPEIDALTWNDELVQAIRHEASTGRTIVLATGAPLPLAERVADHIGGFQAVVASTPTVNMTSTRKARALVGRYGWRGYVYAGNSAADLRVWETAGGAWVCSRDDRLVRGAAERTDVLRVFAPPATR